jgi:hypothetical protein
MNFDFIIKNDAHQYAYDCELAFTDHVIFGDVLLETANKDDLDYIEHKQGILNVANCEGYLIRIYICRCCWQFMEDAYEGVPDCARLQEMSKNLRKRSHKYPFPLIEEGGKDE